MNLHILLESAEVSFLFPSNYRRLCSEDANRRIYKKNARDPINVRGALIKF